MISSHNIFSGMGLVEAWGARLRPELETAQSSFLDLMGPIFGKPAEPPRVRIKLQNPSDDEITLGNFWYEGSIPVTSVNLTWSQLLDVRARKITPVQRACWRFVQYHEDGHYLHARRNFERYQRFSLEADPISEAIAELGALHYFCKYESSEFVRPVIEQLVEDNVASVYSQYEREMPRVLDELSCVNTDTVPKSLSVFVEPFVTK